MVRQLCTVLNRNINKKHYLLVTDLSGGIVYLSPVDQIRSVAVMSDSLRPHESQHARPPCPSPTPAVHSDSRPSSQ